MSLGLRGEDNEIRAAGYQKARVYERQISLFHEACSYDSDHACLSLYLRAFTSTFSHLEVRPENVNRAGSTECRKVEERLFPTLFYPAIQAFKCHRAVMDRPKPISITNSSQEGSVQAAH